MDREDQRDQERRLLPQRLIILLGTSSILFLAFVVISPGEYSSLRKTLSVVGFLISVVSLWHFWIKKNDLDALDEPGTGLRRYARGRWVAIYLSFAFFVVWATSMAEAFFGGGGFRPLLE